MKIRISKPRMIQICRNMIKHAAKNNNPKAVQTWRRNLADTIAGKYDSLFVPS